jgi:hypothetical protein
VTARSRAAAVVAGSVAGLPAATLAEVIERSALQARVDHKYLVPLERFAELAARLPDGYAVLEIGRLRGFAYESVYFDTPDLLTYRQHLQGRRRRYKVRTRPYLTYDVDLTCTGAGKVAVGLSRHVLVETKRHGPHGDADSALRSLGLRPIEMSKYCVAVALLHPGIRHNPWHRTLRRYFV